MSNYLTVAQTTEALRQFLNRSVQADVQFAVQVLAQKPFTEAPAEPTVTVFLYEVAPNPSQRNIDSPTRTADGTLLHRPRAAIDLHYLISFYGSEAALQPQQMLGSVVRSLNAEPVLLRQDIEAAAAQSFLAGGDLAAAQQRVRFTPTKLDVDDLYKLWTMLIQVPYALSVMYQGSLVLLDGDGVPAAGKPVLRRTVTAVAGGRPVVERLLSRPAGSTDAPVEGPVPSGSEVLLLGSQLRGDGVVVRAGDLDVVPSLVADDRVVFALPDQPADQAPPPGIYPVSVLQDVSVRDSGGDHVLRRVFQSNVTPLVRQPRIVEPVVVDGTAVTVQLDMPVGDDQRVDLLLDELAPPADRPAASYQFSAPFPLAGRPDRRTVRIPAPGVRPADYLVQVQVDGVRSLPGDDLRTPVAHLGA